ncbi:MAG: flippase-like domain-containing protein [Desulfomonile tiedjei]|nr:flippase-like domain-containing protein [Desulfomonile tiedjei]
MNESKTNSSLKRNLLIVFGTLLGLVFLYITFKDISWKDLLDGVRQVKLIYFLPCAFLMLLIQFIRASRFGLILRPFCRLSIKDLWDILNLWAAASMIMPARLGELVRPYLVRQSGGSFSSALGGVIVERFFDLSSLLLLLAIILWTTPQVPPIYTSIGEIMLVFLAIGYAAVLLVLARREKVQAAVTYLLSWLPPKAAAFLGTIFQKLLDGFGIMASFKQAVIIFLLSLTIWVLFSTMTYLVLLAFSIEAPFLVAVTIQVFICFGVALPSAPGFIGTFHAAGRYALTLFGIQAISAVSFATVYHLFSVVMCLLLGLSSYWTSNFRFDSSAFSGSTREETDPRAQTRLAEP